MLGWSRRYALLKKPRVRWVFTGKEGRGEQTREEREVGGRRNDSALGRGRPGQKPREAWIR